MKVMYSLNEIGLLPSSSPSKIASRKDVNPYVFHYNASKVALPIFVAPMPCIVNETNYNIFNNSLVQPILPRSTNITTIVHHLAKGDWTALSLKEFEAVFIKRENDKDYINTIKNGRPYHVCIDMANGHMKKLVDTIKEVKKTFGNNIVIMAGNVAHPMMYKELSNAGADYVRVGIGGGNACSTSVLTGIHASLPWLLEAINNIRTPNDAKVVADGGIDTIDKAIKCLALGADFVMMGKMFAQCEEACGKIRSKYSYHWDLHESVSVKRHDWREYYGNASEEGQKDINGKVTRPSEGIKTEVKVITTLDKLCKDFENALRSAMSYTSAVNLSEFRGKVEWKPMSMEEFKSYYKKDIKDESR